MKLSEISNILNISFLGKDQAVSSVVIDSRLIKPGDVFIAIKGDFLDGHDFIAEAEKKGAIAIIAEKKYGCTGDGKSAFFQVENTRDALGEIAAAYRARFNIPFVGVTGSCGKTSTKTLIASVLSQQGKTLATVGTLNNDLGVPLTLLRLDETDAFAVIEMGANHIGEIEYLASLAKPDVAVITNSGPVHLEGFGSIDGVRKAKGEIFESLSEDGIGIVNADDEGASYWMRLLQGKKVIRFGLVREAEISAKEMTLNDRLQPTFVLCYQGNEIKIHLPLIGAHQVPNALAAAAIGISQGLKLEQIKKGLESTPLTEKRGVLQTGFNQSLVIDDSYNANPKAFDVAIQMLMAVPTVKKHILVMGDMGELGEDALEYHAGVGRVAQEKGVDALYTVGKLSQAASKAFGTNGFHFENQLSLIEALKKIASPEVCFLVKGSKSSHMGDVVRACLQF